MSIPQEELRARLIIKGVKFIDASQVYLCEDTEIGKGTIIEPFVIFGRNVKIEENCYIRGFCHIEDALIKANTPIGPFARIRGNSTIGEASNIGNFVEINRSQLEAKVKVAHLTYIGDTTIGYNTNIGAGVITCNYDGYNKNKTKIGNNCFIGSNSIMIAPVEVEDRAFIAAGSVVNKKILKDEFAIARSDLKQIPNGATKYRNQKEAKLKATE